MSATQYWWENGFPWRLIQTNLREVDMLDIDAGTYVTDLKRFHATVVMINSAGIIANYPTAHPFHFQNPYLKGSSLKEIIARCHEAGIKVIARSDFSKVRPVLYEQHPEWAYRSPQGEIINNNGDVQVCPTSDYQQKYTAEIVEEMLHELDVDGLFFNSAFFMTFDYSMKQYGNCHCINCKQKFETMYGCQIPLVSTPHDIISQKYEEFKRQILIQREKSIYEVVNRIKPGLAIANFSILEHGFTRHESNTSLKRALPYWQYSSSDNTKTMLGTDPCKIPSNASVDFIDFPYRHTAVSRHEQKLRLAQNLANGGVLDYYLMGRLDNHEDRSAFNDICEMFQYHSRNEANYCNLESAADLLLVTSPEDKDEYRGWFRMLTEHHILFDVIQPKQLDHSDLTRYKAVLLPNVVGLNMEQSQALDDFALNGGIVIATGRTGQGFSNSQLMEKPTINCLGIKQWNHIRSDLEACYLKLVEKPGFTRTKDTELFYLMGDYVHADYEENVQKVMKFIPPHMYGPPERCYYTETTDDPGYTVHRFNKGIGIYIPWEPGKQFYKHGQINTFHLIGDILEHVARVPIIGGTLHAMVEVTLHASNEGFFHLLHLINNSGHFGVTYYEAIPMKDVKIIIEYEGIPSNVTSLVTGESLAYQIEANRLSISIPSLELFEAIKIEN
jgi:hypothetical protein